MKAVRLLRPDIDICFVADQANVPYGSRNPEQVQEFAAGITKFLIGEGAELIVVACNAASASALYGLRETFPNIPFVGMEPAVKPAANLSSSRTVGVLATPVTFHGKLYNDTIERFASNVNILTSTCPGLVEQIEAGNLDGLSTRSILEEALIPMIEARADMIVLGCTHYPFVIPLVQSIVGPNVNVIDPSPAIARQVDKILNDKGCPTKNAGHTQIYTSGNPGKLIDVLPGFLGNSHPVRKLRWNDSTLISV